eukprot:TRINITY_DN2015_c0_g2_i3.p1 TRINITY_DN2015_c0_g2~~TRINITY_DN2015_c0_g2_i3.p1  ORF type:complete len:226 (+),score=31.77 TRINITY_DN2015_c0_g2_i3:2-679(+)
MDILAELLYYSDKPSANMWELYPLLINISVGTPEEVATRQDVREEGSWAFEQIPDLVISLQNFITEDPVAFLSGTCPQGSYIELMFRMITRIIEINKFKKSETGCILAMKLILSLLEGHRGTLGPYLQRILAIVLEELNHATDDIYKSMLLQMISMCCWNSLEQSMSFMETHKVTEPTFKLLFSFIDKFTKDFEIKRILYGLITFLEESHHLPMYSALILSLIHI